MTTLNPDDFPPGSYHELPLFPLNNVVLFPAMPLPLHIFEERYKAMIGDCINRNAPFGVLLIREGREVGAPATPPLHRLHCPHRPGPALGGRPPQHPRPR